MEFKKKTLFIYLLIFSFILIFGLFAYLFKIENNIKNYSQYKKDIINLLFIEKEFKHFFLEKYQFVNFDEIVKETTNFELTLNSLFKSNIENDLGKVLIEELDLVKLAYKKELSLIEDYKSMQASTLNSLYYLIDLNKTIQLNKKYDKEIINSIDNIAFSILHNFIGIENNLKELLVKIESLEKKNILLDDIKLKYFIIHSKKFISLSKKSSKIRENSKGITLDKKLNNFSSTLDNIYKNYLEQELIISILFFISCILIMFSLIKIYLNTLKVKNELLAFKYAVEHSDNAIVLTDVDRNILYVNENFESNTGYYKDEILGQNPKILASGLSEKEVFVDLNKKLNDGKKWEGELINRKKDGTIYYEKASIVPIFINNKLQNYLAIKLDVTQYVKQREELKESSIVFNNTQEGILITDSKQRILLVNNAFQNISGYTKEELLGKKPSVLKSNKHDRIFYKKMWLSINEKGYWKGKVYDQAKDGTIFPTWLNITAVKDKKGNISKYISIHTNLQDIIENQEKADYLAYHDSLTNLPNRIKLEEHLSHVISVAKRDKSSMSILFIDLDRFKIINDTLGHQVGDRLLQNVASRIKKTLRDTDMVARMGGDEFIVVLETAREKKEAAYVCQKILNTIKDPIKIGEHTLNTSASIGIAMFPSNGDNISTLVKNADTAMYHAKKEGKNNYQYYNTELSIDMRDQLKIEQALKFALPDDEIYLNYQPQYTLKDRKIIAFEALVRWNSKKLGFTGPDAFIPIAEDTGMIIEIGEFIFEQACKDFIKFKEVHNELKYIAINISSIQFRDKKFIFKIKNILKRTNILASQVEIEITERYIMEFNTLNLNILGELRELGFRMSIDDFGTGYSSMNYLSKLPIDIIKVDKSFVDDIPQDNNNVQISKAIIAISKSLGYENVAEGIETKEQEDCLLSLDCAIGQGYLFSRPLDFENAIKFLKEN